MDVRGWLSEHPSVDLFAAGAVVAAHVGLSQWQERFDWLDWVGAEQRVIVYQTGAGVIALLGGLCAIGVSVLLAGEGARSTAVRQHYGRELRRTWIWLLLATFLAAALCVVAQTLDGASTTGPTSGRWVFEFAMLLSGISLGRLVWLVDRLMAVADQDAADPPREPAPQIGARWRGGHPSDQNPSQRAV